MRLKSFFKAARMAAVRIAGIPACLVFERAGTARSTLKCSVGSMSQEIGSQSQHYIKLSNFVPFVSFC